MKSYLLVIAQCSSDTILIKTVIRHESIAVLGHLTAFPDFFRIYKVFDIQIWEIDLFDRECPCGERSTRDDSQPTQQALCGQAMHSPSALVGARKFIGHHHPE